MKLSHLKNYPIKCDKICLETLTTWEVKTTSNHMFGSYPKSPPTKKSDPIQTDWQTRNTHGIPPDSQLKQIFFCETNVIAIMMSWFIYNLDVGRCIVPRKSKKQKVVESCEVSKLEWHSQASPDYRWLDLFWFASDVIICGCMSEGLYVPWACA